MITDFEEFTYELTDDEENDVPILIEILSQIKKEAPLKSGTVISLFNSRATLTKIDQKGCRLRKMINYIRCEGKLPIMSSTRGYWTSYDEDDILRTQKSLRERARSINRCADGLSNFLPLPVPNVDMI